ncbi:MAG: hypothetical protein OXM02_05850 [Bacteroidota bacterium]|nr:hypothetical protein [Bacteroidota bacterium]MDE2834027.1 hypothetical protein [Bacteroidota bacterium]MDE2957240.1 hypothetical protein [Bacteroidota bacterium]
MNWIWVVVPIIAIAAPFAFMIAGKWMDYRVKLAEAQGGADLQRRLAEAETALASTEKRIEKLEAVVVDQLLDAPAEPAAIAAGSRHNQSAV